MRINKCVDGLDERALRVISENGFRVNISAAPVLSLENGCFFQRAALRETIDVELIRIQKR